MCGFGVSTGLLLLTAGTDAELRDVETASAARVPSSGPCCRFAVLALVLLLGLATNQVQAYTFRVGADAACSHAAIQGAIQSAFDNGPGEDNIYIARNQSYTNERLVITGQSVKLYGGLSSCDGSWTGSRTIIDGDGGHSVLEIVGDTGIQETVTLIDLELTGGGADVDHGGALQVAGLNRVILENVAIDNNRSQRGGGIYFDGAGGGRVLIMKGSTIGAFNEATEAGGGIYCVDAEYGLAAPLVIDDSSVGFNFAPLGAGAYLDNCYLSMRSRDTRFGIVFNEASASGGGVYATNGSTVFTNGGSALYHDARPLIAFNRAVAGGGGGVFLDASEGIFRGTEIASNRADIGSGGGISAVNGAEVRLGIDINSRCSGTCSRLVNNDAGFGGGIKADNSNVIIEHTRVAGNEAARASAVAVFGGEVSITGSTFSANAGASEVLEFQSSNTEISYSTVVDNADHARAIYASVGDFTLLSSIVHEGHGSVFVSGGVLTTTFGCLLTHESASLPPLTTIRVADPHFVDRAAGNYHLSPFSPAIDFCSALAGSGYDMDHDVRGLDSADHADLFGPYDIGADEYNEEIFASGFED